MIRSILAVSALSLLVGCGDGQPFVFGAGGSGGTPTTPVPGSGGVTPESLAVNLFAFSYNAAGAGTLTLDVRSLDAGSFNAPYTRAPGRDVAGYRAFEYQADPNNRRFLAFVSTAPGGTVTATAVADGGQFNKYFGGAQYTQGPAYSAPASGLVTYSGSYAGVITIDTSGRPIGNPAIFPYSPSAVSGDVVLVGDFTNAVVNGSIYNRQIISEDGVTVLPPSRDLVDLALVVTTVASDGSFAGTVERDGAPGVSYGQYGGTFGGSNASDVAGVVFLTPYGSPGTWEHGIFVLPTCNAACPTP